MDCEAMKYLAERAGVSLPEGTDAKRAAQEQNEGSIYTISIKNVPFSSESDES